MKSTERNKKAVVCHSGGMDSSICLALAIKEFGAENVVGLAFSYHQRHPNEIAQAAKICQAWGVDQIILDVDCLQKITTNALMDKGMKIEHVKGEAPNTLVVGRNGLFARLGAIYANHVGAHYLYMGVLELEESNSGYRDCNRPYIDLNQQILRIDLADPHFEIRTPMIKMSKKETMELAEKLGVLDYLLKETITCYEGIAGKGCERCPACLLRNEGICQYQEART
jgi:7-cyano-7-deazaguanine synthase